ncbi:hypothetical protein SLEP1_g43974 [Rubroshorea leprosula]|uniref:RING-type domain-containing protein n=1 Tax=Rubroshorea leprosula TaxID=152421 RepID=A0AAV5LER8_9ROSI|nr:hypothetical protein SLEP1_g43974 [Rubroshorea leprosula]
MEVSSQEQSSSEDKYPLLMEQVERHGNCEHIINITENDDALSSSSHDQQRHATNVLENEDTPSSSSGAPNNNNHSSSSSNRLNTRNSSFTRGGDGYGRRRHRSPLNSGLWISVELVVTVSQIVASVVVLSLSGNEHPQAPLFQWIVGYASGCVATLPVLYWRFRNRNQGTEQDSTHLHQSFSQSNPSETTPYTAITVTQALDEGNNHTTETAARNNQIAGTLSARLNGLVDHFKMALDCFFAVWFVVGNVWIFGGHTSPHDAPKLYRLCIVFLTFSCIGYAMPFILCATICCCLPCIISVLGFREEFSQTRGATVESINALPTYKFKSEKDRNVNNQDNSANEGGVLAAGTAKERTISGEDAVCCICLAKYADNDELRELPCVHVFHVECVDKWLKINASCPLCKSEVGENCSTSPIFRDPN